MFRKAFALAVAALCASAASTNYLKVVNLANHVSTTAPTVPYTNVVTLKPRTVYDLQAANGSSDYLVVQCPAAKAVKTNGKMSSEKAFVSYITISTGNGSSDLEVVDAKTGNILGVIWAQASEGYGSQLTVVCVNGRATVNYNQKY
jgi:hypothetical protein